MEIQTRTIDQLGASFKEPSTQERFEQWAERTVNHATKAEEEEKKNSGHREISHKEYEDKPEEERKWLSDVAQGDESQGKNAVDRERGERGAKSGAKAEEPPSEPISGDVA